MSASPKTDTPDVTNGAGAVMTYAEAADLTVSEIARDGIAIVRDEREKSLVEFMRGDRSYDLTSQQAEERKQEESLEEMGRLTRRARKLTFALTALMETSAVVAVVEQTGLGSQVADAIGYRRSLNDQLMSDLAPVLAEVADSYSGRISDTLNDLEKLIKSEGASDEQ
ncbi:MAG: hypothetical protein AAGA68_25120 [Pseudomonadota bacterium]